MTPSVEIGAGDRVAEVLQRIVAQRKKRLAQALDDTPPVARPRSGPVRTAEDNAFLSALETHRGRAIVAEIKMGSPKLGSLADRVDPLEQARRYARRGAAALSVVVEPDFFHGSYELLTACRRESGLPAIAKDFVVDPLQLWWAKRSGADAILLIAALYDAETLGRYARMARGLGLVPLVETHDVEDLELLVDQPWELVGVNNRDLRTFQVDLAHSEAMVSRLPPAALKVAESGIASGADVDRLSKAGFDAFLVGESLLLADDPGAKLAELKG